MSKYLYFINWFCTAGVLDQMIGFCLFTLSGTRLGLNKFYSQIGIFCLPTRLQMVYSWEKGVRHSQSERVRLYLEESDENATITGHLQFAFEETSGRKAT